MYSVLLLLVTVPWLFAHVCFPHLCPLPLINPVCINNLHLSCQSVCDLSLCPVCGFSFALTLQTASINRFALCLIQSVSWGLYLYVNYGMFNCLHCYVSLDPLCLKRKSWIVLIIVFIYFFLKLMAPLYFFILPFFFYIALRQNLYNPLQ